MKKLCDAIVLWINAAAYQRYISNLVRTTTENNLKNAIDVLHSCAARGAEINPEKSQWFEGYKKACEDIKRSVVDAGFNGRPLPVVVSCSK